MPDRIPEQPITNEELRAVFEKMQENRQSQNISSWLEKIANATDENLEFFKTQDISSSIDKMKDDILSANAAEHKLSEKESIKADKAYTESLKNNKELQKIMKDIDKNGPKASTWQSVVDIFEKTSKEQNIHYETQGKYYSDLNRTLKNVNENLDNARKSQKEMWENYISKQDAALEGYNAKLKDKEKDKGSSLVEKMVSGILTKGWKGAFTGIGEHISEKASGMYRGSTLGGITGGIDTVSKAMMGQENDAIKKQKLKIAEQIMADEKSGARSIKDRTKGESSLLNQVRKEGEGYNDLKESNRNSSLDTFKPWLKEAEEQTGHLEVVAENGNSLLTFLRKEEQEEDKADLAEFGKRKAKMASKGGSPIAAQVAKESKSGGMMGGLGSMLGLNALSKGIGGLLGTVGKLAVGLGKFGLTVAAVGAAAYAGAKVGTYLYENLPSEVMGVDLMFTKASWDKMKEKRKKEGLARTKKIMGKDKAINARMDETGMSQRLGGEDSQSNLAMVSGAAGDKRTLMSLIKEKGLQKDDMNIIEAQVKRLIGQEQRRLDRVKKEAGDSWYSYTSDADKKNIETQKTALKNAKERYSNVLQVKKEMATGIEIKKDTRVTAIQKANEAENMTKTSMETLLTSIDSTLKEGLTEGKKSAEKVATEAFNGAVDTISRVSNFDSRSYSSIDVTNKAVDPNLTALMR